MHTWRIEYRHRKNRQALRPGGSWTSNKPPSWRFCLVFSVGQRGWFDVRGVKTRGTMSAEMDALTVVNQLRDLAADPLNRRAIVEDQGCLPGLILFLDHPNPQIVYSALLVSTIHSHVWGVVESWQVALSPLIQPGNLLVEPLWAVVHPEGTVHSEEQPNLDNHSTNGWLIPQVQTQQYTFI